MVQLQLQDQDGYGIAIPGIQMADTIEPGSPNDLEVTKVEQGATPTDSLGTWKDQYFVCSPACPSSGKTDALQYWTYNGVPLPHANTVVYKCGSITIDGK